MDQPTRSRFDRRLQALRQARSPVEAVWRDLADYIDPRLGKWWRKDGEAGARRDVKILNSRARLALRTLVSGMMMGASPKSRPWFQVVTEDPGLMEVEANREWCHASAQVVRDKLAASNVYKILNAGYREYGLFGTEALVVDEDDARGMRAMLVPTGEYYIATGAGGTPDTLYRETALTVAQVVGRFGLDGCSRTVKRLWEKDQTEALVDVVHAIEPNDDRMHGRLDWRGKPWRSVWYEVGAERDDLLRVGGYHEQPFMAPRFEVVGNDAWGIGPGISVLGDTQALQAMELEKQRAIAEMVKPDIKAPAGLKDMGGVRMGGGRVTYYPDGTDPGAFGPLYQVQLRIDHLAMEIGRHEERISRGFYEDLFLLISQQTDVRTATEIAARNEEKFMVLGPVVEQTHDELLAPLVERAFAICARRGLLPPPPPDIENSALKLDFTSTLASAQKAIGLGSIERLMTFAASVASFRPDAAAKIDGREAIDQYAKDLGVTPKVVVPDDVLAKADEAARQQQQAAMTMQMAQQAAQGAKVLADTAPAADNLLGQMAGMAPR